MMLSVGKIKLKYVMEWKREKDYDWFKMLLCYVKIMLY